MNPAGQSWRTVLDRSLLIGCAAWILLQTPTSVLALTANLDGPAAWPLGIAVAARLVLAWLCLRGSRSGAPREVVVAGYLVGILGVAAAGVAVLAGADLTRPQQVMLPVDALQACQLWAVATATSFLRVMAAILATGPLHLALQWSNGLTEDTLTAWLTPTSATVATAALVVYLRSGSVYAEQLDTWNRAARRSALEAAGEETARAEARRVLHDDVISALRGVERGAPAELVMEAARRALDGLVGHPEVSTREELIDSLRREAGLEIEVVDEGWDEPPPVHVIAAFRGAAAEALRNVARHSGTDAARLEFYTSGRDLVLRVLDEGRGLAGSTPGFGTTTSIVGRMDAVGGSARVVPVPVIMGVGGTLVDLRWTLPAPPPHEQVTPYASDQRWKGYLPVALAVTANSSVLAVLNPGPHPGRSLLLLLLLACLVPWTAWRFAFYPPRLRDCVAVAVVVATLTWIGLTLAGPGALLDMRGWVVGSAGSMTMLVAFDARWRHALVPILAQVSVMLGVAAADPTVTLLEPTGALTTPVVISGFSALFGGLLRRGTRAVRAGEAVLASRLEQDAWQAAQTHARQLHLATLRDEVSPFLRGVAAGGPELTDPVRAAVLASRCRDDLHLPHPLPEPVRRAVDEARGRGVTVNLRAGSAQGAEHPTDALAEVLAAVLSIHDPEIVTVMPGVDPRVIVIPALRGRSLREVTRRLPDGSTLGGDEVRTVITVSSDPTTGRVADEPLTLQG